MKPIILYGNNPVAKRVYLESKNDENFRVAAICVGDNFFNGESVNYGLPLVAESEVTQKYPPNEYDMLSCVDAPSRLRNRLVVYDRLKNMNYSLRNFISPFAYVYEDVKMLENNIIFAFAQIGDNSYLGHSNIIRNAAIISHDARIGNGTNIGTGSVIGGSVNIGDSCWLGLNCTINNCINISNETLIGSGAVIIKNTDEGTAYVGNPARVISSHKETGIMLNF